MGNSDLIKNSKQHSKIKGLILIDPGKLLAFCAIGVPASSMQFPRLYFRNRFRVMHLMLIFSIFDLLLSKPVGLMQDRYY